MNNYRNLIAWKKAVSLVAEIYRMTQGFPRSERFGLTAQLRRSAVSVPSNIAEGQGRLTPGESRLFVGNAGGSLYEVEAQLLVALELGFTTEAAVAPIIERTEELSRILTGFIYALENRRKQS